MDSVCTHTHTPAVMGHLFALSPIFLTFLPFLSVMVTVCVLSDSLKTDTLCSGWQGACAHTCTHTPEIPAIKVTFR